MLVGDCRQLEPLVVCKEAKDEGMNISLMERWEPVAEKLDGVVKLNLQFRMNRFGSLNIDLQDEGILFFLVKFVN